MFGKSVREPGDTPVRTGIQTSAPGYVAPMHWHPYVELLFIIEGEAEVWLYSAKEAEASASGAGDCVASPPSPMLMRLPHASADQPGSTAGIHSESRSGRNCHRRETRRGQAAAESYGERTNLNSTLSWL